jgi:hypothetical protein
MEARVDDPEHLFDLLGGDGVLALREPCDVVSDLELAPARPPCVSRHVPSSRGDSSE